MRFVKSRSITGNMELRQLDAEVENAKRTILHNLPTIERNTPSVILKLGGAEQAMNKAKSDISMGIDTINRNTNAVKQMADTILQKSQKLNQEIKNKKQETRALKNNVKQSETLSKIRKEQAEALKQKYGANLHSSWLGLYRPLADDSRVALLTSGIVLCALFLVSLAYYFWDNIANIIPAYGGELKGRSNAPYEFYLGGWRKSVKS